MSSRDYYKVSYNSYDSHGVLDNETECNANRFRLYDDFSTDLRINYNPLNEYNRSVTSRTGHRDSGVDVENNTLEVNHQHHLLEKEVLTDPWSSMDSSSPLSECVPSAADSTPASTSSDPDKPNVSVRNLTLDLDLEPFPRRHFLDEDFPNKSNIECRIPKPHFLDHSPSPDEFDERSDITNPNFLDDEVEDTKNGAVPKKPNKVEDKPKTSNYRSAINYGLDAARSSERDKRASQLFRGTWPGDWNAYDTTSVKSFSSNGSAENNRMSTNLENKMECVCSLISLLSLSPENNADLSGPLLEMSRSVESCVAMRQAGCIPLLVQLIHSKVARETRDRAAKALRNIIHTQTDDKAGRREARVWRLLEQVREYCYTLEDIVEVRAAGKEVIEDDNAKHPSQSVAALMKLSFDEEHRHVVCQLGGLQALAALVSGDQTAHGSCTSDHTCLTMRKYAGMTLTNLTFGDGNNKSLLCSFKDFMAALVHQLDSPNDDMRQVTAAVLRNLSWRADTNSKQVLREVGAVKGLTKAAMTCQKEATLKSVLSALWNLTAHCSMNKVALCSVDGALGFLVDMLSYDSPTKTLAIVENAGGIMRNVSSHIAVREDYRQILRERNCLSVLLQHLKSPSLTVVSNSCGTLWNLSARCPHDQQFLWDHGAVPMLRSLIHSKHKMIAMGSSAALKNLLNSKPGKTHIISLDATARNMNLPALPTLGVRKQKALEQELDQNLAETCDNIEPATSPSTTNRDEKNLFTATEKQIAMNLERHRMTSSSPLMGTLPSQMSMSHSPNLSAYLSVSNTLLKGALTGTNVNRSDSKDSVTSTHSDPVFDRVRTGKVPVPTPRNKLKTENGNEVFKVSSTNEGFKYPVQAPIPPPRSADTMRTNYTESGYDVEDSCDQPIDYSQKYSETKGDTTQPDKTKAETKKFAKKEASFGDYQETDLDQPTDYSLRYAEHQSEGSDTSDPPINEDTIKHFATEGTPYETPVIISNATSMSDLRVIGKDKPKTQPQVKENPEIMTHSDEKDTCSIEDPPDNDRAAVTPQTAENVEGKSHFDTKCSSGMISPEKPVNYCDEGTPGYFSRVSSLSSLGEPTEEDCVAKKNAMASINLGGGDDCISSSSKDKEGSKAVTFATSPPTLPPSGTTSARTDSPQRFIEDTPLMFSRTSSLGSIPHCDTDQGSVLSEVSRLTSGCSSPSEIPDSPGMSAPLSPRARPEPRDHITEPNTPPEREPLSVFSELMSVFVVEDTPAQFSRATSLSSLSMDPASDHRHTLSMDPASDHRHTLSMDPASDHRHTLSMDPASDHRHTPQRRAVHAMPVGSTPIKGGQTPVEVCQVYMTEDTPAILSKAGSNSNLSMLTIDDAPEVGDMSQQCIDEVSAELSDCQLSDGPHDSSDSSNSDAGDLLEECIRKGIAEVVKNKGPPSDVSSTNPYRDEFYRSLPPYLRASTETVRMGRVPADSPPPPLPPKTRQLVAPPRPPPPPPPNHAHDGGKPSSRLAMKPRPSELQANDSLSSLSLDSFGSTDRELFEQTVRAGLSSVTPRRRETHSVERPTEVTKHSRHHKSLDRSDKIMQHRPKRERDDKKQLPRSPYSYHGDSSLPRRVHNARYCDDGPPSLPARIDDTRRLERSNSLSSLSNDSFGSTDKEVFERCVKMGMSQSKTDKTKVRSDDRLEIRDRNIERESRRRRKDVKPQSALDKMVGEEYSKDRAILEEVIARGAGMDKERERDRSQSKNVLLPSVARAAAGEQGNTARNTPIGCERNISPLISCSNSQTTPPGYPSPLIGSDSIRRTPIGCESEDIHSTQNLNELEIVESSEFVTDNNETTEHNYNDSALEATEETIDQQNKTDNEDIVNLDVTGESVTIFDRSNELPTVDSGNTTFESTADYSAMDRSNECMAVKSVNTTIESEIKDELNRSNESYADVLDGSFSDSEVRNYEVATLTRKKNTLEYTDIKHTDKPIEDISKRSTDTWNDNTCPDDVTFPTISGSVHMVSSIRSEIADAGMALPDLLEKSDPGNRSFCRPDLTNKLEHSSTSLAMTSSVRLDSELLDNIPEPSFCSLAEGVVEGEKYESILSCAIEKEAARLAAQLKTSVEYTMETSVTSLTSLDLDNVRPPSNLGSLLSLSTSGHWDETSQLSKKSKNRKKSLPIALMVKRALSNSQNQGSSEHLDSNPVSFLDNVKPPLEMEHLDMESSIISVSSLASDAAEPKDKNPVQFDFKQPIQDFPLCNNFVYHDLDNVNPPSLFEEMAESTVENEQTTAQNVYEDCLSTLNVVTDIPSGSETCTPIPSDVSSVESTPKKRGYLTPKEKRNVSKDRYQTYTITDSVTEDDVVLEVHMEDYMTWTKSESDKSDEYVTANSEPKLKRKLSAKQRRMEDRARYQTQTVDIQNILQESSESNFEVETLKQRLATKKTLKQKRIEDAERFRTRTLSEDIPPSPTFVSKDANFENVETTTGYDSLSSNEMNHQQILDDRLRDDDVFSRETDSGHNDDDEITTTQMLTYTASYKSYLPVVEGPTTFDMCTVKNLKNIEMTESYRRREANNLPSTSDFASYEADAHSESDSETPEVRPKPIITKPGRRESLDSNDSLGDQDGPKSIRGRKKASYVSPYRRNVPNTTVNNKPVPQPKIPPKATTVKPVSYAATQSAKTPNKCISKPQSFIASPKKTVNKSPIKTVQQRPISIPVMAVKPLPLVRQGTFTKEDSSVPAKTLSVSDKTPTPKTSTQKPLNTSPSRLPQLNRFGRPQLTKAQSAPKPTRSVSYPKRKSEGSIKNSASNQSLQSNDSGKTVTLAKGSGQGSSSSVNSQICKTNSKDVESKIVSLWKKVEQSKKVRNKPDRRVWIESDKVETIEIPKLIRSSTFEGQPTVSQVPAPKQKSAIGIRVSQIPSLRPKSTPKITTPQPSTSRKKIVNSRVFTRKAVNGQSS